MSTQGITPRSVIDKIDGNRCQRRLDQSGQMIRYKKKIVIKVTFETVNLYEGRRLFRGYAMKALIYKEGNEGENFRSSFLNKKNHKDTNFAIGGFLAGLHRSPLTLFFFFRIH